LVNTKNGKSPLDFGTLPNPNPTEKEHPHFFSPHVPWTQHGIPWPNPQDFTVSAAHHRPVQRGVHLAPLPRGRQQLGGRGPACAQGQEGPGDGAQGTWEI